MKTVSRLGLLVATLGLGFWLWMIFFPSVEKVIQKRMIALADTATFDPQANNIHRATKALSFIGYFSRDAEIFVDLPGHGSHTFSGRDEIRETANGGFASIPGMKTTFLDQTIRVGTDKQTADVSCTVRVIIGSDKDSGFEEMHFQWRKKDGVWLIKRAETVKTLK